MRIKFEQTNERVTRRAGMVVVNELGKRLKLGETVDAVFGERGSNRGIPSSVYVESAVELLIDGALHREDLRSLSSDRAYNTLIERERYPSSDAFGDWLRSQGGAEGERKLWRVVREVLGFVHGSGWTLDVDATIIKSEKGDARMATKGRAALNRWWGSLPRTVSSSAHASNRGTHRRNRTWKDSSPRVRRIAGIASRMFARGSCDWRV